jgi:hypothetical protein
MIEQKQAKELVSKAFFPPKRENKPLTVYLSDKDLGKVKPYELDGLNKKPNIFVTLKKKWELFRYNQEKKALSKKRKGKLKLTSGYYSDNDVRYKELTDYATGVIADRKVN